MIGFALAALAAVADWWSVAAGRADLERVAKPLVMVGLAAVVIAEQPDRWLLLLAALLMSMVGDVLLLPTAERFVPGLAAFLVAHLAYAAAVRGPLEDLLLPVVVALVAVALVIGGTIVRHAGGHGRALGAAVALYIAVLTLMAALASGLGGLVMAGAVVFAASDAVLGWNRFVERLPHGRLVTHVLYHVGQALIVAGFVRA